jgi:hypothetical protein
MVRFGEIAVKKRGPIGVWFSVAIAIFAMSWWVGATAGKRLAVYWVRHERKQEEEKYGPERVRLDAELDELFAVSFLRIFAVGPVDSEAIGEKTRFGAVDDLQHLANHPNPPDLKPVIDLELGIADVKAAAVEEQDNNRDLAESYMKSAQAIFQSLGWRDTSEENLKNMMNIEFDRFDAPLPAEGRTK